MIKDFTNINSEPQNLILKNRLEQILDKVLSDTKKRNLRSFEENIDKVKKTKEDNFAITYLLLMKQKVWKAKHFIWMPPLMNLLPYLSIEDLIL
jgi:hypothetical protein